MMELLKLSKFKLQLHSLISEARDLRERERAATEHLHNLIEKQKQTEEEQRKKFQELQAELAASNELRQKLERKLNYLQNDNGLLENNQKELKGTIQSLLQSRESFINAYQESTCEMKRAIEMRDRKLTILSEKINSHLSLFDSIEREAFSVKRVVDNVQCLVKEKEEVGISFDLFAVFPVAGLKSKMDNVSEFEKVFVEKISVLENKVKNNEDEVRQKDKIISELEGRQETAKISNSCQIQVEEISTQSLKIICLFGSYENLPLQALHHEVGSLGIIIQRIQEIVSNMNEEDKMVFSLILAHQGECDIATTEENKRIVKVVQIAAVNSSEETSEIGDAENRSSPFLLYFF
ncbi:hypothetical protein CFOL_v3_30514 [Cephalotus follicularis]|uniref:Uncharacterized protein n=1 Tax=Cephalotus follicularis TaxID=3775 RepID=A0A1Q3D491_CEPFO|nr:hypothetical protein CFOL_v3_30514 [Cephalotus follicularis]